MTPNQIKPTLEAQSELMIFYNEIVDRCRSGELGDVVPFASRWAEQASRLAIGLHAAKHGDQAHLHQLSQETAQSAIALAKWFSRQQLALLARGRRKAEAEVEDQIQVMFDQVAVRDELDFVTARDLQRARISSSAEHAHALLQRLVASGFLVARAKKSPGGGRPTTEFRLARRRQNNALN